MFLSPEQCAHYRPNVGIMLFQGDGQVWLGRRLGGFDALDPETHHGGYRWQMPQGGIDTGESVDAAAFRELKEETGTDQADLLMITPGWLGYDFPPEYKRKKWRGQRQKWAIMRFTGTDGDFDLAADGHPEFDQWQWADLQTITGLIVPFKKPVYEELVAAFAPLALALKNGAFPRGN
ncbi:MAG: RNA pyrophosphohydrolase [Pseudomonadota bacterium]